MDPRLEAPTSSLTMIDWVGIFTTCSLCTYVQAEEAIASKQRVCMGLDRTRFTRRINATGRSGVLDM